MFSRKYYNIYRRDFDDDYGDNNNNAFVNIMKGNILNTIN